MFFFSIYEDILKRTAPVFHEVIRTLSIENIDIYGIGNPLIDLTIHVENQDLDHLELKKGTMHLISLEERERILSYLADKEISYGCGGSAPNTLIALAALGRTVALAGKIADDEFGRQYRSNLPAGHFISQLTTGTGTTGSSIILVTPDAERTMNTFLAINREFFTEDVDLSLVGRSDLLYFTGYMWDTENQKDAVLSAIRACKSHGGRIVFDVADPFAVDRNREEFKSLIENEVDIVFANREEASIMFGTDSAADGAEVLSSLCDIALVKDGARGSVIKENGGTLIPIPIHEVLAVDSTGAGDMYAAGFIYGLCEGFELRDAGICAAYLASRIVEQRGAQFDPATRNRIAGEVTGGGWRFVR